MRLLLTTTTLLSLLLLPTAARAQEGARKNAPPPSVSRDFSLDALSLEGTLQGDTYSNDFFGLSLNVPKGWVVQDEAMKNKFRETGKKMVEESVADSKKKAGLDAALRRTRILLSASKYEPGTVRESFNAIVICLAERVPTALVKTGADYVAIMRRSLDGTTSKMELTAPLRTVNIGGHAFTVANIKMTTGPAITVQRHYVTITKGYALLLAYTYIDEADLPAFDEIIKSVRFK
jgi:hypothetical protein